MTDKKPNDEQAHLLHLAARRRAELCGVSEVLSFDDTTVTLRTVCGEMTLEGEGLRVGTLNMQDGVLAVDGRIDAVYYTDGAAPRRRGFFGHRG